MFYINAIQFRRVLNNMLRTSGFSKLVLFRSSSTVDHWQFDPIIKTPSQFVVPYIPFFRFSNIRLEIWTLERLSTKFLWILPCNTNMLYLCFLVFRNDISLFQVRFLVSPCFCWHDIDSSSPIFDKCFNFLLFSVNIPYLNV